MKIASDLDGMMFAYPHPVVLMLVANQKIGGQSGILTARSSEQRQMLQTAFNAVAFTPDFIIGKDEAAQELSDGTWKGKVCKDLEIDVLFDDFEYSNAKMIADFFVANDGKTVPFTSWAYRPE